jgi:hypothetical protein
MTTEDVDPGSIRVHLNELKSLFDKAILEGEDFAHTKKIYMEIKELECYVNVLDWQADKAKAYNRYHEKKHTDTVPLKNPYDARITKPGNSTKEFKRSI